MGNRLYYMLCLSTDLPIWVGSSLNPIYIGGSLLEELLVKPSHKPFSPDFNNTKMALVLNKG